MESTLSSEKGLRDDFVIPTSSFTNKPISYFEGHSLGLQPKNTSMMVNKFLDQWAQNGVEAWFKQGWLEWDLKLSKMMAPLLGALPEEITFTSGLSENIHKVISTFYKPNARRNKIIVIHHEFSSDIYAVQSQINLKGLSEEECMITVHCDPFNSHKATEEMIEAIEKNKDQVQMVWFSMVNYLTSAKFDIQRIA